LNELAELTSVAGSEGEPLFFNYLRDMFQDGVNGPLFFYDSIGDDLYRLSDIDGGGTPALVFSNIGSITSLAIEPVSNYLVTISKRVLKSIFPWVV
jgi:hypothetical protein